MNKILETAKNIFNNLGIEADINIRYDNDSNSNDINLNIYNNKNNESNFRLFLRDEIVDAIDRGDLQEELSNADIENIIDYISNDDIIWSEFDHQIGCIFNHILENGIDYIKQQPINPIIFEK